MSLIGAVRAHRRSLVIATFVTAMMPGSAGAQNDPNPGNFTVRAAADFSNSYMFRGIGQEEAGLILWPAGELGISFYSGDGGLKSADVSLGVWNSLHSGPSGTEGRGKAWYEGDFYATLGLGFGRGVGVATTYTAYTSPNNAFSTVKEIMFKLSVDDSSYMGTGALKPYVAIARELGVEAAGLGQADAGGSAGTYVELGVAPGWAAKAVSLAVPVKLGLGKHYYELNMGSVANPAFADNGFGFFSVAGTVTMPLKFVPASYGAWDVHAGVEFQKYGDNLKAINGRDDKVIFGGGIALSY